jgi:nitrogen fixation NifU-like protein
MSDIRKISKEYLEHLMSPKNYGKLSHYQGKGIGINPHNSERVEIYIAVDTTNTITDIKFQAIGCTTTVTGASILTDMIKGESVQEALDVTQEALGQLENAPAQERACGEMVAVALLAAVESFQSNDPEATKTINSDCLPKENQHA